MSNTSELQTKIGEIFKFIGVSPDIDIQTDSEGVVNVGIEGDDLNFLIGYRGESLDALQTLLGVMTFKETGAWETVVVDINGYRKQKQEKIEQIAR